MLKTKNIICSVIDNINPYILGIEKTLSFRTLYTKEIGVSAITVITSPFLIPNLKQHFEVKMEFEKDSTIVLPNLTSDIGMADSTYRLEDYLKDNKQVKKVVKISNDIYDAIMEDGRERLNVFNQIVMQSVFFKNGKENPSCFSLFSEKRYLTKDYKDDKITYYNRDGTVSLTIKDNEWILPNNIDSRETFLELLLDKIKPDIIIRDRFNVVYNWLRDYSKINNILYVGYLHYSPFGLGDEVVESVRKADYDVIISCNPDMIKDIKTYKDLPIIYIPPVFNKEQKLSKKVDKRFLMLTSNTYVKRNWEIFEWIKEIDELTVDVYGLHSDKSYKNINFQGHVSSTNIDWSNYIGYISNSITEAFSIALFEAISNKCYPVVSDVDYAHRTLAPSEFRYKTFDEFKRIVNNILQQEKPFEKNILETKEMYLKQYSKLIKVKGDIYGK